MRDKNNSSPKFAKKVHSVSMPIAPSPQSIATKEVQRTEKSVHSKVNGKDGSGRAATENVPYSQKVQPAFGHLTTTTTTSHHLKINNKIYPADQSSSSQVPNSSETTTKAVNTTSKPSPPNSSRNNTNISDTSKNLSQNPSNNLLSAFSSPNMSSPSSLITQVSQNQPYSASSAILAPNGSVDKFGKYKKRLEKHQSIVNIQTKRTDVALHIQADSQNITVPSTPISADQNAQPLLSSSTGSKTRQSYLKQFITWVFCCISSDNQAKSGNTGQAVKLETTQKSPVILGTSYSSDNHDRNLTRPTVITSQKRPSNPVVPQQAPTSRFLLKPQSAEDHGKKCLVLDLDETLVHSSFKPVPNADFIVPVEIDNVVHNVYVLKRPFVDEFLKKMGEIYEVVIFTASLSKYADPVIDNLDIHHVVRHRLFRESCFNHRGSYVKDLSQLGRDLSGVIILDNSPTSYLFHPGNAVPVTSWFNDTNDIELMDLIGFLTDLSFVDNVVTVLDNADADDDVDD